MPLETLDPRLADRLAKMVGKAVDLTDVLPTVRMELRTRRHGNSAGTTDRYYLVGKRRYRSLRELATGLCPGAELPSKKARRAAVEHKPRGDAAEEYTTLEVACGTARGQVTVHTPSQECFFRTPDTADKWYTGTLFEAMGGRATSKKWRATVRVTDGPYRGWAIGDVLKRLSASATPTPERSSSPPTWLGYAYVGAWVGTCCELSVAGALPLTVVFGALHAALRAANPRYRCGHGPRLPVRRGGRGRVETRKAHALS